MAINPLNVNDSEYFIDEIEVDAPQPIVVTDFGEASGFHLKAIEMLRKQCKLLLDVSLPHPEAMGIILHETKIDKKMLDAMPNLKIIARFGVGYDNVDVEECTKRGIYVTHNPDATTESVADLTMGLILALARRIVPTHQYVLSDGWAFGENPPEYGIELEGKVLGIVGYGRIGKAVERRAKAFGMHVLYHDIGSGILLPSLLRLADFVSLHVPLTSSTRKMISRKELEMMKPTACLINTSRGEVVDQRALFNALRHRAIAGAALDVFEEEPAYFGNRKINRNVVLSSHRGSATFEAREKMSFASAQEICRFLKGRKPFSLVPEQRGKI